jgi:hypothetical protein
VIERSVSIHAVLRDGKFTSIHTFLSWQEGLHAAGLPHG